MAWRATQLIKGVTTIAAFNMPSKHSGGDTKQAATVLAGELGVTLRTIPIHDAVER